MEQARGTTYIEFAYDPTGRMAQAMTGQVGGTAIVALPGGGKALYASQLLFRHPDWLGTSRLTTTLSRTVYYDGAYAPFGENYAGSGTTDLDFTGQIQNTVTGLYDFPFREYSPVQGRWISPDPSGLGAVDPSNPQSWNRYAYVGNLPTGAVDPLGLWGSDVFGTARGGGIDPLRDPGGAWLAAQTQQFMAEAGLLSPMQQGLNQYLNGIPGYSVVGNNLMLLRGSESHFDPDEGDNGAVVQTLTWEDIGPISGSVPANGGIDLRGYYLYVKNLDNGLSRNFRDEFRQGGCVRTFIEAAAEEGLLPDSPPGYAADELTQKAGEIAAAQYVVSRGLVVPLRSSIYRGILDGTAGAASGILAADFLVRAAQGVLAEGKAMWRGNCH